jgi:hypothetical protein
MSRRKTPGKGSRLRNSEMFRVSGYYDTETVEQAQVYAAEHGISLAEALRQLVEFGLEALSAPPISTKQGTDHASASAKG